MASESETTAFVRLHYSEFSRRFVECIEGSISVDRVLYGRRVRDYATGVASMYWKASLEDGRSPEAWASDDMEFWAADHNSPFLRVNRRPGATAGSQQAAAMRPLHRLEWYEPDHF